MILKEPTQLKERMQSKQITLSGEDAFIKLIASQFGLYAPAEIELIKVFIKFGMFNGFHLDKYTRERIRKELNAPYSTLSNSLRKLVKCGVIARQSSHDKTMYFNVAFRGLSDLEAIVFKVK